MPFFARYSVVMRRDQNRITKKDSVQHSDIIASRHRHTNRKFKLWKDDERRSDQST